MYDDIDHTYALQIENSSESDPRRYEPTKAAAKKTHTHTHPPKDILRLQGPTELLSHV